MTPSGIEPANFRFVAQLLNHCATAVPIEFTVLLSINTGRNKQPVNTTSLTDGRDDCQRVEKRSREGPVVSFIQIVLPIITFLESDDDLILVGQQLQRYIFLPVFLNKKRYQLQQLVFAYFYEPKA